MLTAADLSAIAHEEVLAAVAASGEHECDSITVGTDTGRKCVACGVWEADDGDMNYEGTHAVSVPSDNLSHCKDCSDCFIHPACASDGRCPHCAMLDDELENARDLVARIPELTLEKAFAYLEVADRRSRGIVE